jgi:hypothetical protein
MGVEIFQHMKSKKANSRQRTEIGLNPGNSTKTRRIACKAMNDKPFFCGFRVKNKSDAIGQMLDGLEVRALEAATPAAAAPAAAAHWRLQKRQIKWRRRIYRK